MLAVAGVVVELVLLAIWQRNGYWDYSDGVYSLSAREFLHGLVPYRDFAAAQPPPVYLVGLAFLWVHDGLASLRAGLAVVDLITAVLVALAVWRLSGLRWLAAAAAFASPLLPITLHEHAQLTPETLAAPLLIGGALLCARRARAVIGAMLLALAAACKLAFALPALAIALASPTRRKATLVLIAAGAVLAAAALAAFGTGVWREAGRAQLQVGHASLHYAGGLIAQAGWSEFPLIIAAAIAVWLAVTDAPEVLDVELTRTLAAGAIAGVVLALTVFKRGSYINVLVPADPLLLALAACGAAWAWRRWRAGRVVLAVLGVFLAAQSVSVLADPSSPSVAKRPGAASGLAWTAGANAVNIAVSAARRCPRTIAYSRDPYFAFLADRRMPGDQPDPFMLQYASTDVAFAARASHDQPRCP